METGTWFTFAIASALLVAIPGPTILLVVSYSLSHGRRIAIATAFGVALGDAIAASGSLLGLGALLLTSAWVFSTLKWAGAIYLIYLGIKMLNEKPQTKNIPSIDSNDKVALKIFCHAATVTALNPKGILFFLAFAPQFINSNAPIPPQFTVMLITFVLLGAVNALIYALMAAKLRDYVRTPKTQLWINRIGGTVLIGMGFAAGLSSR